MNRDNRPIVNIFSKTALVGSLMVVLVNQAAAGLPVAGGGDGPAQPGANARNRSTRGG